MTRIEEIVGIGDSSAEALKQAGLKTTEVLLQQGATARGRAELAQKTGLNDKQLLRWINHADLMRVKGIGGQYAELLEAAGVDTIPELGNRKAENLQQKLVQVNGEKKLVRKLPTVSQVDGWVRQAKQLPRIVTY